MTAPDDKTEREHCERAWMSWDYTAPETGLAMLMRERQAARAEGFAEGCIAGKLGQFQLSLGKLKADFTELQSKHERLVAAARTFTGAVEAVLAHAESPKTGMQVPFHGDFVGAQPSVLSRLRWHMRNINAAISGRFARPD